MKKMTRKSLKRLMLSLGAMVIAIAGAATSTFAWITMNASPRVGDLSFNAAATSGLKIAIDTRTVNGGIIEGEVSALDFKSFITSAEIQAYLETAYPNGYQLVPSHAMSVTLDEGEKLYGAGKRFSSLHGDVEVDGKFASSAIYERAYIDLNFYFRISVNELSSLHDVVLDVRDFGDGDFRSYAKGDLSNTYTLPTAWTGSPYSEIDPSINISSYIKVETSTNRIMGINMYKYYDNTNDKGIFVDPRNGDFYKDVPIAEFNEELTSSLNNESFIWTNLSTQKVFDGTSEIDATNMMDSWSQYSVYEGMYYLDLDKGVSKGAISVDEQRTSVSVYGATANAIRMSFETINNSDKTNLNNRVYVSETNADLTIWNPNENAGRFASDEMENNFALHMLLATDGVNLSNRLNVETYLNKHKNSVEIQKVSLCNISSENSIDEYCYGAVSVKIWIEGWDAECFNSIMGNIANVAFQFRLVNLTQE